MSDVKKRFFITLHSEEGKRTESYDSDCFVLGKSKKADLSLPLEGLSRQHLEVKYREGNIWLEDLGSTFGTVVNKIKLVRGKPYLYAEGDLIRIGVAKETISIAYRLPHGVGPVKTEEGSGLPSVATDLGGRHSAIVDTTQPLEIRDEKNDHLEVAEDCAFNSGFDEDELSEVQSAPPLVASAPPPKVVQSVEEVKGNEDFQKNSDNKTMTKTERVPPPLSQRIDRNEGGRSEVPKSKITYHPTQEQDVEISPIQQGVDLASGDLEVDSEGESFPQKNEPAMSKKKTATQTTPLGSTNANAHRASANGNAALKTSPSVSFESTVDKFRKKAAEEGPEKEELEKARLRAESKVVKIDAVRAERTLTKTVPIDEEVLDSATKTEVIPETGVRKETLSSPMTPLTAPEQDSPKTRIMSLDQEVTKSEKIDPTQLDEENLDETANLEKTVVGEFNGNAKELMADIPDEVQVEIERVKKNPGVLDRLMQMQSQRRENSRIRGEKNTAIRDNSALGRRQRHDGYDRNHLINHVQEKKVSENQLQIAILAQEVAEIELAEYEVLVRDKIEDLKNVFNENVLQEKKLFELKHLITQKGVVLKQQKEEIVSLDEEVKKSHHRLEQEKDRFSGEMMRLEDEKRAVQNELSVLKENHIKEEAEIKGQIHELDEQLKEVEQHIEDSKRIHQDTLASTREMVEAAEEEVKEFRQEKESLTERLDEMDEEIRGRGLELKNIETSIARKIQEADELEEKFEERLDGMEDELKEAESKYRSKLEEVDSKLDALGRTYKREEEDLNAKIDGVKESKTKIEEEFDQWCLEMDRKESELRLDMESIISRKKEELAEFEEENIKKREDLLDELKTISSEAETKRKRKERIEEDLESLTLELREIKQREEERIERIRAEIDEASVEYDRKREENVVLLAEVKALKKNVEELESEVKSLREKRTEHEVAIDQLIVDFDRKKYQMEAEQDKLQKELAEKKSDSKNSIKAEADKFRERLFKDIEGERRKSLEDLERRQREADEYSSRVREEATKEVDDKRKSLQLELDELRAKKEKEANSLREKAEKEIERMRKETEDAFKKAEEHSSAALQDAEERSSALLQDAEKRSSALLHDAEERSSTAIRDAEARSTSMIEAAQKEAKQSRADAEAYSEKVRKEVSDLKANEEQRQAEIRREVEEELSDLRREAENYRQVKMSEWKEQETQLREALENEFKLARLELEKEIEFSRSSQLDAMTQEKEQLEEIVERLQAERVELKERLQKSIEDAEIQLEKKRVATAEMLKDLEDRYERESQDIEDKLEEKMSAVLKSVEAEEERYRNEMKQRRESDEKHLAEKKLTDLEDLRIELEEEKKKANRERRVEIESVTKNIQSALKSRGGQLSGGKEEDEFMNEISEVVEAVMGDDPDLKRNLVVKIDKNVKEKERRFWIRLGLQVTGLITALTILIALPDGFFGAVGASVWATISSDESAAEIFARKILEAQSNRPKYNPPKDAKFKKSYADNILFTEQYFVRKMDVDFQQAWTIALNAFIPDQLKLDEEIVPKVFSVESVLLGKLAESYDRINPDYAEKGIEKLHSIEAESVKELKSLLGKESNFKKFKAFEKKFYTDFYSDKK